MDMLLELERMDVLVGLLVLGVSLLLVTVTVQGKNESSA
jgi:hypothetical protein